MNEPFLFAGDGIELSSEGITWRVNFEDISALKDVVCVIVDHQRRIIFTNQAYRDVLKVEPRRVLGRKITEIEPESRCDLVLRTQRPLLLHPCNVRSLNLKVIGNVIPLMKADEVVGSLAAFVPVERFMFDKLSLFHPRKVAKVVKRVPNPSTKEVLLPSGKQIVEGSSCFAKVLETAAKASATDCSVLLMGESGVGKEIIAEFIHYTSPRKNGPLVKVNCAAIPESLLESELFGYNSGAFTGASRTGKPGKFEQASRGTLFLDEVGDMSLSMQAKLLRAIEEKKIDRLGGTNPISVDVRIIAATNQELRQLVKEKKFREDLFFRLYVFPVQIPPLRRRKEDIPLLAEHFAHELCPQGVPQPLFTEEALGYLVNYAWPGNIRELQNLIQYALITNGYSTISVQHLPPELTCGEQDEISRLDDMVQVEMEKPLVAMQQELEKKALIMALQTCNFNKSKASALLGITRRTLYLKMKKYHLCFPCS